MRAALTRDAQMFFSRWGTSRKPRWMLWGRLLLLTPGFQLGFWLRVQRALKTVPVVGPALRRCLWYVTTIWFSCDVDPEVEIGPGLYLPHPLGIVIGGGVKIALAGPLRLRVDYRVFKLGTGARFSPSHRIYAGLNLKF